MDLVAILEAGRRDFLDAARDILPEQASAKPTRDSWSVLECIEHVIFIEDRYLGWISGGTAIAPQRDAERELRLFTIVRSRLTKVEAPDVARPQGRFDSLTAALAEFKAVRDRSVQLVQERGEALYSIGAKHPYFGNLNGFELVHLIDGHARRHADQIRETRPAPLMSMKPTKAKKTAAFKRDRPDLPAQLESAASPQQLFAASDLLAIEETRLEDVERANLTLETFRVEGSVLERVHLAGGQFGSVVWKDVRLVGCDLANIRAHRISLLRVELVDCRLTGFRATALDWQDVLIQNGDVRYAQFQGGRFRTCEFDACNWEEADLQEADLSGSIFRSCNLARADLQRTKLQNTDFRKSEVESMLVGMSDLRGAIVDPAQAMIFARLLGLQIA
ncbi:MAG: pentapeptide repeat-containing protein [Bryobacteraceae bacterium]|jgi:uncharacterized protein YjbI with pentapeptide repeats